jgi:hypothetical protein
MSVIGHFFLKSNATAEMKQLNKDTLTDKSAQIIAVTFHQDLPFSLLLD